MNNIGEVYKAKEEYETALEYFQKSLEITQKRYGEGRLETVNIMITIGEIKRI